MLFANGGSGSRGGRRRESRGDFLFILIFIFPLVVIILGHPIGHAKIVGIAVGMLIRGLVGGSETAWSAVLKVAALHDDRLGLTEVSVLRDENHLHVLVAFVVLEDVTKTAPMLSPGNSGSDGTVAPMFPALSAKVGGEVGQLLISFLSSLVTHRYQSHKIISIQPPADLPGLSEGFVASRGIGKENTSGSDRPPSALALTGAENGSNRLGGCMVNPGAVLVLYMQARS